jgi:hypothetical protein
MPSELKSISEIKISTNEFRNTNPNIKTSKKPITIKYFKIKNSNSVLRNNEMINLKKNKKKFETVIK